MKRNWIIGSITILALAGRLAVAEGKPDGEGKPGEGRGPGGPEGRPHLPPEELFKMLDTDGSKALSLDEVKAGPRFKDNPDRAAGMFKRIDKDADGKVTFEEFKAGRPPRPEGRPPHGEGRGEGHGEGKGPRGEGKPPKADQ